MNKIYSLKKVALMFIILLILIDSLNMFISNDVYAHTQQEETNMLKGKGKKIDNRIKKSLNSLPVTNLSIIITNQDDEIYSMEYGSGTTANSSFALGSTSKAFTALAMLTLAEEYDISLDTPVKNYLPEIHSDDEITIKDLLNHTSGIGTYEASIDNLKFSGKYGAFEYANMNYNLVGKIIEVISKDTFSNYIKKQIYTPLKMEQSFAFSNRTKPQVVQGYSTYFGFSLPFDTKVPNEKSWIQEPSGYLCSSTTDMGKFLRYMLGYSYGDQQLLSLVQNEGVVAKNSPAVEDIYSDVDGIYSLGWINKTVDDVNILYHTGKLSNFCSISVLIPESNIGISILCNFGDFLVGTKEIENLFEEITSVVINKSFENELHTNKYVVNHITINLLLLVLLVFCTIPFFIYNFYGVISKLTLINGIILILVHLIIPYILLNISSFIGISQQALMDFAPDIYIVFLVGALVLFATGIWKISTLHVFYSFMK